MTPWRRRWPVELVVAGAAVIVGAGLMAGQAIARPSPTATPHMTFTGPIVDNRTGIPVTGDVYVGGQPVQEGVTDVAATIPLCLDRRIELRVEAEGYQTWAIAIRGRGTDQQLQGPVRMVVAQRNAGPEV